MIVFSQYALITILAVFLVFHILVLAKIIPFKMVWGGRLKSEKEMYRFEAVSILVNCFILFIIISHAKIIPFALPETFYKVAFWMMAILFVLNTFGNMVSKNKWEKLLFTPITILLSIFSLILALSS